MESGNRGREEDGDSLSMCSFCQLTVSKLPLPAHANIQYGDVCRCQDGLDCSCYSCTIWQQECRSHVREKMNDDSLTAPAHKTPILCLKNYPKENTGATKILLFYTSYCTLDQCPSRHFFKREWCSITVNSSDLVSVHLFELVERHSSLFLNSSSFRLP